MKRKAPALSPDTVAIISAVEAVTATAKVVSDAVSRELVLHTAHDDERFEALTVLVTSVAHDVKSLLASRSFTQGVWKAATVAGGLVGGAVALIALAISWWRG